MEKQRRKAACARPTTRARPAPVVIPVDSPQWQVMLVTDDTIGNGPDATARDMQKVQRVSKMVYSARGNPVIRSELLRPLLPPPEALFAAQPATTVEVAGRDDKTIRRASLAADDE